MLRLFVFLAVSPAILSLSGCGGSINAADNKAAPAPPSGVFNVRHYGAKGDGKADDTAAIQDCIDAAPEGDLVTIPCGQYRTTRPITVKKTLSIVGTSAFAQSLGHYGDVDYGTGKLYWGSVILYEGKSDAAIDHDAGRYTAIRLENLAIIGVGDGTRASTGFRSTFRTGAPVAILRSVTVTNFKIGLDLESVERSHLQDLFVFGCDTGILCRLNTNANTFTNVSLSNCGDSIVLDGAAKNVFLGGAIQGSVRNGVILRNNAEENSFRDIYFENSKAQYAIDIQRGDSTAVDSCHFGTPADRVRTASNGCRFQASKYSSSLEIKSYGCQVVGVWSGKVDAEATTLFLPNEKFEIAGSRLAITGEASLETATVNRSLSTKEFVVDGPINWPGPDGGALKTQNRSLRFRTNKGKLTTLTRP